MSPTRDAVSDMNTFFFFFQLTRRVAGRQFNLIYRTTATLASIRHGEVVQYINERRCAVCHAPRFPAEFPLGVVTQLVVKEHNVMLADKRDL